MTKELVVAGLCDGASLALLAVAFYLAYSLARTFHVALAGIYALAPFVAWALSQRGVSLATSAFIATIIGGLVSMLCEILNHGPLRRRQASAEAHLLSSLGLYVVIVQILLIAWGPEARVLRTGLEPSYVLGGLNLRRTQAVTLSTTLLSLLPFWLCLRMTRLGLVLRAFRDSPTELALVGFNTTSIRRFLFALAGLYCALAALVASLDGGFQAHYGFPSLLLAVVATLSVRRDSILGPVVGGFALGLLRTFCAWGLGARWEDTLSYTLFAGALLLQKSHTSRVTAQSRPIP